MAYVVHIMKWLQYVREGGLQHRWPSAELHL